MSQELYEELAAEAASLLAEFGQAVPVRRQSGGGSDPVTGERNSPTTQTFAPKGILAPYPSEMIDGTQIMYGDRLLILEHGVVELKLTDQLDVTGKRWTIQEVIEVNPAGVGLVYRVQLRGAARR